MREDAKVKGEHVEFCKGVDGHVEGFEEVAQVAGPGTVEVLAETPIGHWTC